MIGNCMRKGDEKEGSGSVRAKRRWIGSGDVGVGSVEIVNGMDVAVDGVGSVGEARGALILFFNVPLHGHINPTLDLGRWCVIGV